MGKRGPIAGAMRGAGVRGGALPERVRIPPEVRADPDARGLWRELLPLLRDRLVGSDLPAFRELCLTWAELCQVRRELATSGYTTEGRNGEIVKHPLVAVESGLRTAWRAGCDRFGLSPSGRGRLPEKQEGAADLHAELAALLLRGSGRLGETAGEAPAMLVWQVADPEGEE
jgi:P27 family predicted phage terminase small subunit